MNSFSEYIDLGIHYYQAGQFEKALRQFTLALEITDPEPGAKRVKLAHTYITNCYIQLGDYDGTIRHLNRIHELIREEEGHVHNELEIMQNKVDFAYQYKRFEESIGYAREVLEIKKNVFPEGDPNFFMSYINLGGAYSELRQSGEALTWYRLAHEIAEKGHFPEDYAPDDPDKGLVILHWNTAAVCMDLCLHEEALRHLLYVSEDWEVRGNPDLEMMYRFLIICCEKLDMPEEEERHLRCLLEISESSFPPNYFKIATIHGKLGELLVKSGRFEESLKLFNLAFEYFGKTPPSKEVSQIVYQLHSGFSTAYMRLGRLGDALYHAKKSLKIREEILPAGHPDIVSEHNLMGELYSRMERHEEALFHHKTAHEIASNTALFSSLEPINIVRMNWLLGRAYFRLEQYEEAEVYLKAALEFAENALPGDDMIITLNEELALTYIKLNKIDQGAYHESIVFELRSEASPGFAERLAEAVYSGKPYASLLDKLLGVLDEFEKESPPDPAKLARIHSMIGKHCYETGKYEKALTHLTKELEIRERYLPEYPMHIAAVHNYLHNICMNLNKYEDALKHQYRDLELTEIHTPEDYKRLYILHANLSTCYMEMEKFNEAARHNTFELQFAEKAFPAGDGAFAQVFGKTGVILMKQGKYDKALESFNAALEIGGDEVLLYNHIGTAYERIGQYEKALEYFLNILEKKEPFLPYAHPTTVYLHHTVGQLYMRLEQCEEALRHLNTALKLKKHTLSSPMHPYIATLYNDIGSAYLQTDQFEEAMENIDQAVGIRKAVLPSDPDCYPQLRLVSHVSGFMPY